MGSSRDLIKVEVRLLFRLSVSEEFAPCPIGERRKMAAGENVAGL